MIDNVSHCAICHFAVFSRGKVDSCQCHTVHFRPQELMSFKYARITFLENARVKSQTLSLTRSRTYVAHLWTHIHKFDRILILFPTRKGKVVRRQRSRPPILPHTNPPLALTQSQPVSPSQSVSQSARARATGS